MRGLANGADDYVVKPFSVPEFLSRIKTILRRVNPDAIAERLKAGDIAPNRRIRASVRKVRAVFGQADARKPLEHRSEKCARFPGEPMRKNEEIERRGDSTDRPAL